MTIDPETLYTLYLDESGVGKTGERDEYDYFGFGGILVRKPEEAKIEESLIQFKKRWSISRDIPLHACEIRSMRDNFRFLKDLPVSEVIRFKTELLELVCGSNLLIHGCIVHRSGYLNRYGKRYGRKTWMMLESAAAIVIERAAKYVLRQNGRLYVVFERGNTSSNELIRKVYSGLLTSGPPFSVQTSSPYAPLTHDQMQSVLFKNTEGKTKANMMLQIADSCLRPIMEPKITQNTKAFDRLSLANRLINNVVERADIEGIKYYCFD